MRAVLTDSIRRHDEAYSARVAHLLKQAEIVVANGIGRALK